MPLDMNELIRRYVAGESCNALAKAFRTSSGTVSERLRQAGVDMRPEGGRRGERQVAVDSAAIVSRYLAGESEKALADALGTNRTVIRNRLLDADIQPRGRSESMYLRMSQASPEERARLASAAHDSVRGKPKTPEFLIARAIGVERQGAAHGNASPAELMLASMLRDAGVPIIHQKAIGPYNVDLAVGSVAVEVLGGGWHRAKLHGERLRYLLDAGWDVIYVWVNALRYPLGPGAGQYVVAHCEFRDRNPSAPRCYRVIRGGGEFVAEGSSDGDDIPDVLPVTNRPDVHPAEVEPGTCRCGCGRATSGRVNPRTGKVAAYISGHNARAGNRNPR